MPDDAYDPATYGDRIASAYDELYANHDLDELEAMVDRLAELAGHAGPVLELGIGTGRIALPLVHRGVEVRGIDASEAMVAQMRSKPGGSEVPVHVSSFADFNLDARFSTIFVAFNTFFALLSQEEQLSCVRSVSRHLLPGGAFALEAFVPDLARYTRNQNVQVTAITTDSMTLNATRLDPVAQRVTSQHVALEGDRVRMYPVQLRYAWPAELDLMARLAGLELDQRLGNWQGAPFTADSTKHVSIYRLPTT